LRGDIKTISGPKMSILQNHPQIHHDDKHKTYLYKNTIHLQTHLDNYTTYFYAHTRKKPRKTMSLKIQKQKEKITKKILKTKTHIPNEQTPNKSTHLLLLICGDIERNPGPKLNLLLNHPQIHQEKHNTYFYKNTTQIKIEYKHIFELFKPYLNHMHIENTNPHLKQFCINNQQYPHNHLFYAILITLAPTPTQCDQLISENST
jgi:hypothetical protein